MNYLIIYDMDVQRLSPDGDVSWVVSTPESPVIGCAAQAKPVKFESAGASALHTPSLLVLIQVTRWERKR